MAWVDEDDTAAGTRLPRTVRVSGVVSHGEHRGRAIGFPTANLYVDDDSLLPPDGVYAGYVRDADKPGSVLGASAISVGTNPTFGQYRRRLEAHILDFDADIYGRVIEVELIYWLRGMVTFEGVTGLIAQIDADVALTRLLTSGPAVSEG